VPHLPLKLVIIDESIVLFGMEDPVAGSPDLTLLVIEHPSLAQILKIAFGAVWASGLTFEQAAADERTGRAPPDARCTRGCGGHSPLRGGRLARRPVRRLDEAARRSPRSSQETPRSTPGSATSSRAQAGEIPSSRW
jgi:hypothetical protein